MENNLVTQKYLYILTKNILDILVDHINNIDNSHTIDNMTNINIDDIFDISNVETISTENICPKNMQISVNDISLDANHKFVTEEQIDEFNNKASKEELDKLVSNYKSNMRQELNERFDQLLNNKNILDKLKINFLSIILCSAFVLLASSMRRGSLSTSLITLFNCSSV